MTNYEYVKELGSNTFYEEIWENCHKCKNAEEFKDWLEKERGELNHICEYISNEVLENEKNNVCRSCRYGLNTQELGREPYCIHAKKYDALFDKKE